jgi:hypothetical protein
MVMADHGFKGNVLKNRQDDILVYRYDVQNECSLPGCVPKRKANYFRSDNGLNEFAEGMAIDTTTNFLYLLGHTYSRQSISFFDQRSPIFIRLNVLTGKRVSLTSKTSLFIEDKMPDSFAFPLLDSDNKLLFCSAYSQRSGLYLVAYRTNDTLISSTTRNVITPTPTKTGIEGSIERTNECKNGILTVYVDDSGSNSSVYVGFAVTNGIFVLGLFYYFYQRKSKDRLRFRPRPSRALLNESRFHQKVEVSDEKQAILAEEEEVPEKENQFSMS